MKQTKAAKSILRTEKKRIFGLVPAESHTRAKIAAYTRGINLEDWVGEAIEEKLNREEAKIVPFKQ
jgi:predicted HicB family RNase H-like nuclease